ncbi:MAG TPA: LD-carboxypeptidase [Bacteroidales bacterium]|nr:LD-carboxypeptidase [Bacteroidales bacterium]
MFNPLSVLKKGDKVIIVAPAGKVNQDDLEYGIQILKSWGLVVELGDYVQGDDPYFAAPDQKRLSDFQNALNNDNYKAIFCARGGYGSVRIIEQIDWQPFIKKPKWIIGYSDITLLLNKIQSFNIPCIHGPMPASFSKYKSNDCLDNLYKLLFEGHYTIQLPMENTIFFNQNISQLNAQITGGNLTLIQSSIGTNYSIETNNRILFLEDVDEYPYKIDRMLYQLYHSGYLTNIRGIILGNFKLLQQEREFSNTITETINSFSIKNLEFIINNFPAGHDDFNYPIVFGNKIRIIKENKHLHINISLYDNDLS